jgi:hypothetical protein
MLRAKKSLCSVVKGRKLIVPFPVAKINVFALAPAAVVSWRGNFARTSEKLFIPATGTSR